MGTGLCGSTTHMSWGSLHPTLLIIFILCDVKLSALVCSLFIYIKHGKINDRATEYARTIAN